MIIIIIILLLLLHANSNNAANIKNLYIKKRSGVLGSSKALLIFNNFLSHPRYNIYRLIKIILNGFQDNLEGSITNVIQPPTELLHGF